MPTLPTSHRKDKGAAVLHPYAPTNPLQGHAIDSRTNSNSILTTPHLSAQLHHCDPAKVETDF